MRIRSVIVAVAALSLPILSLTAGDALAQKIVPIQGKYSKIKLDGICAANGGQSYGTADTAYGCTKGSNTVECNKDGSCTGYVGLVASAGGRRVWSSAESVLQQAPAAANPGMTGGATGAITGGASTAQ